MKSIASQLPQYRRATALALIYGAIVGASFYLAYGVRFDFSVPLPYQHQRLHYLGIAIILKLCVLLLAGQFTSVLSYFGITDLLRMGTAITICSFVLLTAHLMDSNLFALPRGALLVDYLLCLGGLCTARLGARLYRERLRAGREITDRTERIAIIGAGDAGAALASELLNHPRRRLKPVVFLDDDPTKQGTLVHGIRVTGVIEKIAELKAGMAVSKIVIAMPSASAKRIATVVRLARESRLKVETLPSAAELASSGVKASRIRPVEVQDLLGREQINLDSGSIRNLIEDRIVMVTGAGGSIGGELCRQIAKLDPKQLLLVEQAEGNLFVIEQELIEAGLKTLVIPIIGDVLNRERMESIFSKYRPEVVFHAAAHKHVFLMERHPAEAVRNNVMGTGVLADLAATYDTKRFVLISTDKAINPTSVMGATKRLAELKIMKIQGAARASGTKFMAVRFGNVLGSSGSVIPIFKRQIANGGPVTVTHPDVCRYFMTIPEAVGLVLQSAVLGKGGEIFVLDMGQPVKILDLAKQMIELSGLRPGEDIEIKITGLKAGEKLFEELQHRTEEYKPTAHPYIMQFLGNAQFRDVALMELERRLYSLDALEVKRSLQALVPEYTPHLELGEN